jgi:hypothetical protein
MRKGAPDMVRARKATPVALLIAIPDRKSIGPGLDRALHAKVLHQVLHPTAHDLSTDQNVAGMWLKYGAHFENPLVSASYGIFAVREDFLTKAVDNRQWPGL